MSTKNVRRLVIIIFNLLLIAVFGLTTDTFLTQKNILVLLREAAYLGLIAGGMVFVVIAGGADLCAGYMVAFLGTVAGRCSTIPWMPGIIVILITMIVGFGCGYGNGLIITKLHLSDFVCTLATSSVFYGLAVLFAFRIDGVIASVSLTNKSFLAFGKHFHGLYYMTIVWIIATIILQFIITRTKFGKYTTAVGSNRNAALMSGINVDRIKCFDYAMDGMFCGVAAAFMVAYQCCASAELGYGTEFKAMAACAVGGAVLGGGKGDALSAVFGALFMTILTNGLYKWGLSTGMTYLLLGIVIILASAFDVFFTRYSGKLKNRKSLKEAEAA